MKLLEEPSPVPAGISAIEFISTPVIECNFNNSLTIGCLILLTSSSISVTEYFTCILLSKNYNTHWGYWYHL